MTEPVRVTNTVPHRREARKARGSFIRASIRLAIRLADPAWVKYGFLTTSPHRAHQRGMATRRLFPTLSHKPVTSHGTDMSSNRHHSARHDFDRSSTTNGSQQQRQARRPPKQQRPAASPNAKKNARPTHFLALPIGHHPELRNAMAALTSSWLAHEPPIEGLDPSIVVHPRRMHLTLGVMALVAPAGANPNPNPSSSSEGQGGGRDLAGAMALLASLAPRVRAVLARNPLRVPLGRLAIMQTDPARAHVLYAEPELRSPDGRRLREVCGACCFLFDRHHPFFSPWISPEEGWWDKLQLIGSDVLELVHGAFKEAGFLADVRRPLKVRPDSSNTSIQTHIRNNRFFFSLVARCL